MLKYRGHSSSSPKQIFVRCDSNLPPPQLVLIFQLGLKKSKVGVTGWKNIIGRFLFFVFIPSNKWHIFQFVKLLAGIHVQYIHLRAPSIQLKVMDVCNLLHILCAKHCALLSSLHAIIIQLKRNGRQQFFSNIFITNSIDFSHHIYCLEKNEKTGSKKRNPKTGSTVFLWLVG